MIASSATSSAGTIRRRRRADVKAASGRSPRRFPHPADLPYNEGTMRAAFLTGVRTIEIREAPAPRIARDDDVIVRSKAVGVCGSDLHYYLSDTRRRRQGQVPLHPRARVRRRRRGGRPGGRPRSSRATLVVVEPAVSCGDLRPVPDGPAPHLPLAPLPGALRRAHRRDGRVRRWPRSATASRCRRG
ncbi:MAG: alcohol dehydrogenase catalytic domain-containing protein [Candidatus Moduliflexus flocculans]|nr:alcohol dehydrogenase catalytic domain-containing protein [Candidatus Moduliflexus flocculans]